ncbi:hypothetical protein FXF51_43300 [Nonomuraea sp. PA05]|uniref:hypothetical protein n=1 Tax=Nonomuraea sp. PA05 TaxID=2604466 RepID=UPI0011D6CFCD|nr:hypothetical protein [Nonomuraea sp. PA05]TYB56606.1 hypothetical protein FXF51_43300 [Nonomuraea sp. PA05]
MALASVWSNIARTAATPPVENLQMKRHKIFLSVRADTDEALEQVAARVGQAMTCTFVRGEFQRWHAQVAEVFGLRLALVGEYGISDKKVAKLVGVVAEKGFRHALDGDGPIEYERVDISAYVVDLLTIRTGLRWYRPTAEDLAAEGAAARGIDDWHGQVGPQEGEGW